MTDTKKLLITLGIIVIVSFLLGFIIGKYTVKVETKTEIKYVPMDPVTDTIKPSAPVAEVTPPAPEIKWLTKRDTIRIEDIIYVTESVDTAAILSDWAKKRTYKEQLFACDTIGTFDITADVQYNQLQNIGYTFVPVRKETIITKTKSPLFRPYILGGVNSQWRPAIELGTFTRHGWGAGYEFQMLNDKTYLHSLKIGYQF